MIANVDPDPRVIYKVIPAQVITLICAVVLGMFISLGIVIGLLSALVYGNAQNRAAHPLVMIVTATPGVDNLTSTPSPEFTVTPSATPSQTSTPTITPTATEWRTEIPSPLPSTYDTPTPTKTPTLNPIFQTATGAAAIRDTTPTPEEALIPSPLPEPSKFELMCLTFSVQNVRAGPSIDATIIGSRRQADNPIEVYPGINASADGWLWRQVIYGDADGWMAERTLHTHVEYLRLC